MTGDEKKFQEDLDIYADEYLDPNSARTVDQRIITILADRIIPQLKGPNVLEMGYGDGIWTSKIIEKFDSSYIVDASGKLLGAANKIWGSKIITYESYFEEFSPKIKFNSIVCTYVLEHVVDPCFVLKRCREWLAPGGVLVIAVPSATSLNRRLGVKMGMQNNLSDLTDQDIKMGHRRVYDGKSLEEDIFHSGFMHIDNFSTMCKPLPNYMLANLSDIQLKGLFDLGDELPFDQRAILVYRASVD